MYGCGEQPCMAMLSRQLLSVIVTQPLFNSLFDVTMPALRLIYFSMKKIAKRTKDIVPTPTSARSVKSTKSAATSQRSSAMSERSVNTPISISTATESSCPTRENSTMTDKMDECVEPVDDSPLPSTSTVDRGMEYLANELDKQVQLTELSSLDRREFTTEEYVEKVIVYGALLLFSVALPPAPALALLIMRIDLNLDLGRM